MLSFLWGPMATENRVSAWVCRALGSPSTFACAGGAKQLGGGSFFLSDGTVSPPLTVLSGAALLDLEQTTLPGIAHLVVETMIVSDQIRPEDRASVLRTLLLKHRCQGGVPGRGLPGSAAPPGAQTLLHDSPASALILSSDGELIPDSSLDSTNH